MRPRRLELAVETGVHVMQVEAGKPAAKGGLLPGDVIVAMDGKPVRNVDEVHRLLDAASIDRKLPVRAVRGNDLVLTAKDGHVFLFNVRTEAFD